MNKIIEWLNHQKIRREARVWIRHNNERIVADAMFALNRHARGGYGSKYAIYQLKNHLVRLFCEKGFCRRVTLQRQILECWECGGTGLDGWNDYEECWKCEGTGIYAQHYLYRFEFDVHGRRYVWHQPKRLVDWPVQAEMPQGEVEYKPGRIKGVGVERRILLEAAVYEYLRWQGVPKDQLPAVLTLGMAIRREWSLLMMELWRKWFRLRDRITRKRYHRPGYMSMDDIPF